MTIRKLIIITTILVAGSFILFVPSCSERAWIDGVTGKLIRQSEFLGIRTSHDIRESSFSRFAEQNHLGLKEDLFYIHGDHYSISRLLVRTGHGRAPHMLSFRNEMQELWMKKKSTEEIAAFLKNLEMATEDCRGVEINKAIDDSLK